MFPVFPSSERSLCQLRNLTVEIWTSSTPLIPNFVLLAMWQGWPSGESTRLPPIWSGFNFRTGRHMWVEFVGSLLCPDRFFPRHSGFPSHQKPTFGSWLDLICWTIIVKLWFGQCWFPIGSYSTFDHIYMLICAIGILNIIIIITNLFSWSSCCFRHVIFRRIHPWLSSFFHTKSTKSQFF